MAKFNRKVCQKCHAVFVPQIQEDLCHSCIINDAEMEILRKSGKVKLRVCKGCKNEFEVFTKFPSQKAREYCSIECRPVSQKRKKETRFEESVRLSNEKWLKSENKKKKGVLPLDVLIRQSEYKRVFDDAGWDHYLKGRKWDRI